jgi:hypothetical protein
MGSVVDKPPVGPSGYTNQELGYAAPPAPPPGDLPPGDGRYATPHFLTFSGLIQTAARSYRWTSDEALRASPTNARAMRRDAILWSALRARQRPTAQLSWHLEPKDETDPAEAEAAKLITEVVEAIPKFQKLKMQLMEALWFGKYGVEVIWHWETWRGRQVLTIRDFIPINGDKIRFKWDGTPGFLVYGNYPGTWEATDWGMAHFVTPDERMQYIIHEHEPDDADWIEGEMAGSVHGVGLRGRLYWFWWMKQQVFALLMNYLERFAMGLTIYYYAAQNPEAKAQAEAAAAVSWSNFALAFPRWNTENPDLNKVERLEVGTASPALLQNLVTEYFDNAMVKAILGQTLSSDSEGGGLGGGGVADLHGETLDEIIKYDAVDLAETFQHDLINVLYRYNAPGVRPGKFSFEVDTPNAKEVLEYMQIGYEMGVPLDEDQFYEVGQLKKPKPGSGIITNIGAMSPAAVGAAPQGVPVAGQPGPTGPPGAQQAIPAGASPVPGEAMTPPLAYQRNGSSSGRHLPKRRLVRAG